MSDENQPLDTAPDSGAAAPSDETPAGKPAEERRVLITGVTSGIGRAAAEQLAAKGAPVIAVARDEARGRTAVDEIIAATGNKNVELMVADLALMSEVRALAAKIVATGQKLDTLVNNAGVRLAERSVTAEGIETTLAVNHLAPYLLSTLLAGTLGQDGGGRVVNVSSFVHTKARLDLDDIQAERDWDGDAVYRRSKLLNLLLTYKLAREWEPRGITLNAYNPGWVRTNMTAGGPAGILASLFAKSPRLAAQGLVFVAVSPRVETVTGAYFQPTGEQRPSSPESYDEELQKRVADLTDSLLAATPAGSR